MLSVYSTKELFVCRAGDPTVLGVYTSSDSTMDGAPVFTNANEISFYRNNGFWYIGDLTTWPPRTHYRCVQPEGCNVKGEVPPTTSEGVWTVNKAVGKEPSPEISLENCDKSKDEL